ncbi:hypothetical protein ANO14919_128490 [Xylariales sp. No.14919]|nr:hypothetical protein ANO14919_128490 [Xylariales sp. No.14919]
MSDDDDKTTASLDVFILTFNAAKTHIDTSTIAFHLRNAFDHNATDLPELVVICLQEMAPLAHSFIGSYMINPYFQSWVSAVNLAASLPRGSPLPDQATQALESENGSEDGSQDEAQDEARDETRDDLSSSARSTPTRDSSPDSIQDEPGDSPYTLVATRHVGMTGILLLSRDPSALDDLKSTEVGFGAGDMGNKGAVGLRMLFSKNDAKGRKRQTELTFVGAHLAAHEWNLDKRNRNWQSIVSGLLFEDPKKLRGEKSTWPTPGRFGSTVEETQALLARDPNEKEVHDITIYKPGSHLFVAGDLNYRTSKTSPSPNSVFPDFDPKSPHYYLRFLAFDQLILEQAAGRTLHGLGESQIDFPPTYKLDYKDDEVTGAEFQAHRRGLPPANDVVSWMWATHRWPSWCDRVLYLNVPHSVGGDMAIETIAYDALPPVRTSDHRAVYLRLSVPVLEPSILAPSAEFRASNRDDPRVKLPYAIDFEAWDHRERVKKWEWIIGWSMLISQSKRGIAFFTTLAFLGIGAWWLRSR